ncbi:MAG TPA: MlaD family protein [Bryobacteraceae bacterium]|nr:MlaD family protein [Bryobacteraceae bacterium]
MPTVSQINWAKFRVSAVAIVALLILGDLFYLLTGGTLLEKKASLYLYVPDSTGLSTGSPARVDGIDVGKVARVALSGETNPDRIVKVTITVGSHWLATIPADSYAQLSTDTLVGDMFVDVSSGASRNPIRPNGEILYKPKPDVLKRLDLQQFKQQLQSIDAQIADIAAGRGLVGQFVMGTGMYDEWRKLLNESQADVDAIASRNGPLGSAIYSDRQYRQFRQWVLNLDQSLARLESGQGDLGRFLRDDAQYRQLAASLEDLRKSIAGVEGNPWVQSDSAYQDWNKQLGGLIRTVDDFNASPVMETAQVYETLNGMTRQMQAQLRDFLQSPAKYTKFHLF